MLTSDFDYNLPEDRIAQEPFEPRDMCKMMVLGRKSGKIEHRIFKDVASYLKPNDLLVVNETRVMPARLIGKKAQTKGEAEVLLLRQRRPDMGDGYAQWDAIVKPGRRLKPGAKIEFFAQQASSVPASGTTTATAGETSSVTATAGETSHATTTADPTAPTTTAPTADKPVLTAEVLDWQEDAAPGERIIGIQSHVGTLDEAIHLVGKAPLPPYIHGYKGDPEMYQTVYSRRESSAAAPTAGLHFTPELLQQIKDSGVEVATVELEIGLGTFRAVTTERAEDHNMHSEIYHVSPQTVEAIEKTREQGGRVVAVGTTSMRSLESAWSSEEQRILPRRGESTRLFILPGYEFHVVDALITNFHVPKSTLMMLVSAFSTRENIMNAYACAVEQNYRMLSFGDAMLII